MRAWSSVALSAATIAGTCRGVAALSGPSAPLIIQLKAAYSGVASVAAAIRAATGWRQPKFCAATRSRAFSAPTTPAVSSARP
ncbi:hypothetical protein SANTM175S_08292 [Streptomyces antimycoticus]